MSPVLRNSELCTRKEQWCLKSLYLSVFWLTLQDIDMTFTDYQQAVEKMSYGKRLPTARYVFADSDNPLPEPLATLVSAIRQKFAPDEAHNLIKLHTQSFKISLLHYPQFFEDPHPSLAEAIVIDLATGNCKRLHYAGNANPPILHRKETFLPRDHRKVSLFRKLTLQEEQAGLFENTTTIGFAENWRRLLEEKRLMFRGHHLVKVPDDTALSIQNDEDSVEIHRHRTAMSRSELSKPIRQAMELGVLHSKLSVFDYGCGLGTDAEGLRVLGFNAAGWDPAYFPDEPKVHADVVNLGYVLNVIEDPAERVETLVDAWKHTRQALLVSTMIRGQESYEFIRDYRDGLLTARDTFQKYFEPAEIQGFIESALEAEAHPLSMGIYAVFRDPRAAQRFLATRTRRHIDWEQLSRRLGFLRPRKKAGVVDLYERHKDLLDRFWNQVLVLGRLPQPGEFDQEAELKEKIGGPKKVHRLFLEHYGADTYTAARKQRKEDLLVYLAMANFRKRVPLKDLDDALQADIKSHFGTYRQAQEKGLDLLFSTGQEEALEKAIAGLNFGWLDSNEGHFSIHRSLLPELPAALRIYIQCGAHLYGDPQEANIIKIHLWSKKLTFLHYDDFDRQPFPELRTRIKIDLLKRFVTVFDHTEGTEHQLLFFKERFLSAGDPLRTKAEVISSRLRKLGLQLESLGSNDQNAPSKEKFDAIIGQAGLTRHLIRKPV
jgi:DNA phosphorothioation-associated putative methyltransferase